MVRHMQIHIIIIIIITIPPSQYRNKNKCQCKWCSHASVQNRKCYHGGFSWLGLITLSPVAGLLYYLGLISLLLFLYRLTFFAEALVELHFSFLFVQRVETKNLFFIQSFQRSKSGQTRSMPMVQLYWFNLREIALTLNRCCCCKDPQECTAKWNFKLLTIVFFNFVFW